jgi:GTP-binding protein Era
VKCGYVALIGRPNVGKSTLLNHLLKQKISITSRKPQTTRHRIHGINTTDYGQIIYVDTPGMHSNEKKALNRYLNKAADSTLTGVDAIVWLIDGLYWDEFDDIILSKLKQVNLPVFLAVNKIDRIQNKQAMLAFFAEAQKKYHFESIIPVSALKGTNLIEFENAIYPLLPDSEFIYDKDQLTDRTERFLTAEIVREKLMRRLGAELPYELTVEVEKYEELAHITKIYMVILVERDSQKNIIIGKSGEMLKNIGIDARRDIEKLIDKKVLLKLWVKVKKGWSDDERALLSLGFNE